MRDTFVWNLNDPLITPDVFAQSVVEDYGLPAAYHGTIVKSIQEQLSDFKAHTFDEVPLSTSTVIELAATLSSHSTKDDEKEGEERGER
ncbi:hypothetical protein FA13DRAFT_346419 [Coprinellus micaceus]|uniref:Uncharacterized protein n=1 Tax=Coprinellus micaceus TaxID=71717 RepID=A0A4Y7SD31_COPMI|nr:hypothetical protein FA13DRAFT_346419 [Coprinellus micaceus]